MSHGSDPESGGELDKDERFRRVEDRAGVGVVNCHGVTYTDVRYEISRFQGMTRAGLPVPGVHRMDGTIVFSAVAEQQALVGETMQLKLEDGSVMSVVLLDSAGHVVAEGHGPSRCTCC